ncbi:MAG: hypothetical protein EZS28_035210 [Streblomastix strix]|uniref:Uncharacterized protein n=1 Tax=Streblomastix strix TaxID=222440 RepID=A0A5J4UH70_9EUKA|nr:MAG: hypothetical protein EZS28_035210 [Streblomastix strix]
MNLDNLLLDNQNFELSNNLGIMNSFNMNMHANELMNTTPDARFATVSIPYQTQIREQPTTIPFDIQQESDLMDIEKMKHILDEEEMNQLDQGDPEIEKDRQDRELFSIIILVAIIAFHATIHPNIVTPVIISAYSNLIIVIIIIIVTLTKFITAIITSAPHTVFN